ncbi:Cysteine-rich venom protein 6 like protein [Argiope bruennichi]|uniref:Cysteine-rich venom protein 6 like protein n=1 Tax=Argiope bruennichi TaxID=94029 RepID=A0A8T0EH46_ARGBR|nr:Cysteine-rich venom protein 6 like protein [Argiope bruennichi]
MPAVQQLLRVASVLAFMVAWRLTFEPEKEDPIVEVLEEIVHTYEETKSLYDLLAHFPVDNNIVCPERDVHLPYPGDCTRYITCRNYKAHIRGCPRFMKFDNVALRCRFATDAKCSDTENIEKKCGSNEVYLECKQGCEQTCEENSNDYIDCPEDCVKGCFCKEGFVRGPLRNCIPPRKCNTTDSLEPWFLINSRRKHSEASPSERNDVQFIIHS